MSSTRDIFWLLSEETFTVSIFRNVYTQGRAVPLIQSTHVETVVLLSRKNGWKRPKIDKNWRISFFLKMREILFLINFLIVSVLIFLLSRDQTWINFAVNSVVQGILFQVKLSWVKKDLKNYRRLIQWNTANYFIIELNKLNPSYLCILFYNR